MLCPKFPTSEGMNNHSLTPHRPRVEDTVELNLWLKTSDTDTLPQQWTAPTYDLPMLA